MKIDKKSQGLPINVIVIAAIALAVLVVIFVVFTGRFKIFSEGIRDTGLSCKESCKLAKYADGSKITGNCNTFQLGGTFSDVDPSKKEICCCT
ncbi:hypothetical protein HYY71_04265 [Candidatus Woesearchaeota archaeon]|nr:hypothetical protein [Candidatus Woesearchaeota archaeon]